MENFNYSNDESLRTHDNNVGCGLHFPLFYTVTTIPITVNMILCASVRVVCHGKSETVCLRIGEFFENRTSESFKYKKKQGVKFECF